MRRKVPVVKLFSLKSIKKLQNLDNKNKLTMYLNHNLDRVDYETHK